MTNSTYGGGDWRVGNGRKPGDGDGSVGGRDDLRRVRRLHPLYVGSAGVGLGAFLIAMTFRPFPKEERAAVGDLATGTVTR